MTNKLEQEFFKTFDIEPKHNDACKLADKYWYNESLANKFVTFDTYMEINGCPEKTKGCTSECKHAYNQEVYPKITDRILLELICMVNTHLDEGFWAENITELKEEILNNCLLAINTNDYGVAGYEEDFKHQVQALFEEG